MILFKFTLKLIEIDSMKAHITFNWLLFNYQHNTIQNYIFNIFDTVQQISNIPLLISNE
jgi:hypothetical protein